MSRELYVVNPREESLEWTQEEFDRVSVFLEKLSEAKPEYQGPYVPGECYTQGDIVVDSGWQMIANKPTCDKPAPYPIGAPFWVYDGTSPEGSITAKELLVGQRYTYPDAAYINTYRVYTIAGNFYRVLYVKDPDGINEITELISFVSGNTGWQTFTIAPKLISTGTVFELWSAATEPDPTPTTWTGAWDYTLPNNQGIPVAGVCQHATRGLGVLRFSDLDDAGADRSAELLALLAGDTIDGPGGIRWSIQAPPVDEGTYVEIAIAPAQQSAPIGVFDFVFTTVTATPIITVIDTDYFLGNDNVIGLYRIDNGTVVQTQDAYGVDLQVQAASISEDWDVLSASSASNDTATAFGSAGVLMSDIYDYVKYSNILDLPDTWTNIGTLTTSNSPSGVYEFKMAISWIFNRTTESVHFRWRETDEDGVFYGWNETTAEPTEKTDTNNSFYAYPTVWEGGVKTIEVEIRKQTNSIGQLDVSFFDIVWEFKK